MDPDPHPEPHSDPHWDSHWDFDRIWIRIKPTRVHNTAKSAPGWPRTVARRSSQLIKCEACPSGFTWSDTTRSGRAAWLRRSGCGTRILPPLLPPSSPSHFTYCTTATKRRPGVSSTGLSYWRSTLCRLNLVSCSHVLLLRWFAEPLPVLKVVLCLSFSVW